MILLMIKNKKKYPIEFVKQLQRSIMYNRFLMLIDLERFKSIEDQMKLNLSDDKFNLLYICRKAIENSVIIENKDDYTITVDDGFKISGYRVSQVVKLINEGDLTLQPYPIFTYVREYIEKSLEDLYNIYQIGLVI